MTMTARARRRAKSKFARFWKRKGSTAPWHVFLDRSTVSECESLTRSLASIERQFGERPGETGRRRNERQSLPPSTHRICTRCSSSIGFVRRRKRATAARLSELTDQAQNAWNDMLYELQQISEAAPPLLAACRAATEALVCRRPFVDEPRCPLKGEAGARCPNCRSRDRLREALRQYTLRTLE